MAGLYKKKIEPEDLLRAGDIMWSSYHLNSGHIKFDDVSQDRLVIGIYDFPQMDPAHCRLMRSYFNQAMIEAGVVWTEELRETLCMSKGGPYHEFVGRWKPAP